MMRLNNITVVPPGQTDQSNAILRDVTLEIARGDWIVLTGRNGSGKTTLLKALAGVMPLAAGSVAPDASGPHPPRFSLMLQNPANQFVASTVRNELLLSAARTADWHGGARPDADTRERLQREVEASLERFRLGGVAGRNPHHLSGGERQRLAMAAVWLERPDILMLDEPVSFLDERSRRHCIEFVRELNREGVTVVWASPGGDDLLCARTVVYLERGRVRFSGSRDRFLASSRALGAEDALPRLFHIGRELAAAASGQRPVTARSPAAAAVRPVILSVDDVSFCYRRDLPVLQSVSVRLCAGECVGVTGPNGAGKTTLLEIAAAVLTPGSGSVSLWPEAPSGGEGLREPTRLIDRFYLFQEPERIFFRETVQEEIEYGLRRFGIRGAAAGDAVARALRSAGLVPADVCGRSPFHLSFGEMRRVALAVALSLQPAVLLLDEPAACLDEEGREALRGIIGNCTREGRGVLIASHDIDLLAEICDRIVFLEGGRVLEDLPVYGGALPETRSWPGAPKPCVLELQETLARAGTGLRRSVLSRELFVRELLEHAESDVG